MIALLGAAGYVGSAFRAYFEARGIGYRAVRRAEVDYASLPALTAFLQREKPSFVLCAAGYTGRPNVDACELHKTECLAGNAVLPGIVRAASEATGIPFGHISSGCIFTGDKGRAADGQRIGFTEDDAPNFSFRQDHCSFYSGTKALGEEILQGAEKGYVWRLRIPFNHVEGPRNYLTKLMRYARLLEAANSLSQLDEFARACWETVEKKCPYGIYNVTNPGHITTRQVVDLIEKSGVCRKTFSFFDDEEEFMRTAAKTPRSNCILDSSKLAAQGIRMTPVHQAVEEALRNWKTEA
jgi:dTDP-4-dehydrorhamnose reductase